MDVAVLHRELAGLPTDLAALAVSTRAAATEAVGAAEARRLRRVVLVGDGDSHAAACAVQEAFERVADVACTPLTGQALTDYVPLREGPDALVAVISASGATPRALATLASAQAQGALTVAVTGVPGSPLAAAAGRTLPVALAAKERAPGVRSYQASVLGLLALAFRLADVRQATSAAAPLREELAAAPERLSDTTALLREPCAALAHELAGDPALLMLGAGPAFGTAAFAAAKLVEGAGVLTLARELDQWWHVERFADPPDLATFVIAPPGAAHGRAVEIAAAARARGRRVVAVVERGDTALDPHAWRRLPVAGSGSEILSPLAFHVFAVLLAAALGRTPFSGGNAP